MPGFGQQYDTVEDAAAAALMWLARQPRAVQQEYMGMLFQDPETEKFFRGEFATSGNRNSVTASFEPLGSLAGFVHNHPARRNGDPSSKFSPTDVETAKQLGVPGFLAAMTGRDRAENLRLPDGPRRLNRNLNTSPVEGEQFLAQFPIGEFKQALMRDVLGRAPNDPRGLRREYPGSGKAAELLETMSQRNPLTAAYLTNGGAQSASRR